MALTKKQKTLTQYDFTKPYPVEEGIALVQQTSLTKFDGSVDFHIGLTLDAKSVTQPPRFIALLPHGTGRTPRVLVLCTPDKQEEATKAGADHVGLEDYLAKIEKGWLDIDAVIAMPAVMAKLGKLGKILGPKGLMPSPNTGTVTQDVGQAVKDIKSGKINIKPDKYGIVHGSLGRVSFTPTQLKENLLEVVHTLIKAKPSGVKGMYIKSIILASTMGRGIEINKNGVIPN